MNNTNYIPLNSVGCLIEEVTGITYPMNEDGTTDLMSDGVIEDCTEEWFFALSPEDNSVVQDIRMEIGTYPFPSTGYIETEK